MSRRSLKENSKKKKTGITVNIDLIEIMLNKQDGKKFFHQMELKSKLNMSPKDEIDRGSRRKI